MPAKPQHDVLIVGGGMVGLTLACALKDHDIRVLILERSKAEPVISLDRECRVSAIVAGTVGILRGLGVWQYMDDKAGPIHSMRVWDDQNPGGIRFEAGEAGLDVLGYIVENHVTQAALQNALEDASNIEMLCPAKVEDVDIKADEVRLSLDDGCVFTASMIVGADGGRSWLRGQAGIPTWGRDYGQRAIVATVRPAFSHRQTAFQRFLPSGPLAFLPLTNDLCSIVWSANEGEADRLMALDDEQFKKELNLAFGPVLGGIQEAGKRAAFPLCAQLTRHVARPRLALIGDAAHMIHPLAGLGVNLGMRDAMVLAQEIVDARRFGEDIGCMDVLSRFVKARMPDVLSVMGTMEGFHQLFTRDIPGLAFLRDAGMLAVGNSGPLKKFLMRAGMGLSIPVPRQIS